MTGEFDPPVMPGTISPFRTTDIETFGEYITDAIGNYLIHNLKKYYPRQRMKNAPQGVPIFYSRMFDLRPDDEILGMHTPAVGISVDTAEHITNSDIIPGEDGDFMPGDVYDIQIMTVVIASTSSISDAVDAQMTRVLNWLLNRGDSPLLYMTKSLYSADRGFSTIDRFVLYALWQNLTDQQFVRIATYNSAVMDVYSDIGLPEDMNFGWDSVVGSSSVKMTSDDTIVELMQYQSGVSLRFKFTPVAPS
jgi:hypothetical protein